MTSQKHYSDYTTATSAFLTFTIHRSQSSVFRLFFPPGLAFFFFFVSNLPSRTHSIPAWRPCVEVRHPAVNAFDFHQLMEQTHTLAPTSRAPAPHKHPYAPLVIAGLCFLVYFPYILTFHPQLSSGFPSFLHFSHCTKQRWIWNEKIPV